MQEIRHDGLGQGAVFVQKHMVDIQVMDLFPVGQTLDQGIDAVIDSPDPLH